MAVKPTFHFALKFENLFPKLFILLKVLQLLPRNFSLKKFAAFFLFTKVLLLCYSTTESQNCLHAKYTFFIDCPPARIKFIQLCPFVEVLSIIFEQTVQEVVVVKDGQLLHDITDYSKITDAFPTGFGGRILYNRSNREDSSQ